MLMVRQTNNSMWRNRVEKGALQQIPISSAGVNFCLRHILCGPAYVIHINSETVLLVPATLHF
jgi:hypothetical protein